MKTKEQIEVFINFVNGRTACICKRSKRKCKEKNCVPEIVERDKFRDWEATFKQNRYGKSKDN